MKKGLVFLLAASTLFGLGFMGQAEKVEAEDTSYTTTWEITSKTTVSATGAAAGVSATYSTTYTNNANQLTSGNNSTLTVKGLEGFTIKDIKMSMKSNTSKGAGSLTVKAGNTTLASGSGNFNVAWYSSWSTSYVTIDVTNKFQLNTGYTVNAGENLTINVAATTNSLYVESYTVTYEKSEVVEEPIEKTPTEEVNELLTSYYNNGSYQRDTVINLNEDAQLELISCFHANVNILDRITYFVGDELWMLNEVGTYSYYGTDGTNMTSARTEKALYQPKSVHTAYVGHTMEEHYTTLFDIKANEAEWTKTGEVYSTNDSNVVQMFLDFTAPCFLGISDDNDNYFSLDHVEVEQKGETLELRLVTTGDKGKLTDANGVLSVATITKGTYGVTITNIADVLTTANGTKVDVTGKVVRMYNSTNSFYIADEKGNELLVFQTKLGSVGINDIVNIVGTKEYVNEAPRIAKDSTGTLIENNEFTPEEISKTLAEAYEIANGLDKNVVSNEKYQVTGTVVIKENKYYLTDGTKEMQLYGGDNSELHDGYTVTVLGNVTKYSSTTLEFVNYSLSNIIPCNYSVTIENSTNGSVQASVSENLPYGTEVTLTIEADTGYVIDSLIVNDEIVTVSNNTYTFNIEKDTTVSATFKNNAVQTAEETLSVTGDTGELNGTSISWTKGNVTFTNNQSGSSTAIRTSDTDHYRVYAKSEVVISASNGSTISKVVITCTSSDYATAMKNGATNGGYAATSSGTTVTITANNVSEIKFTVSAQTRLKTIVVTHTVA